jgi:drug/metabolite transporter (DMT)-like permease
VISPSVSAADDHLGRSTTADSSEAAPWQGLGGSEHSALPDSSADTRHGGDIPADTQAEDSRAVDALEAAVAASPRSAPLSTAWTAEFCLWFTAVAWGTNLLVVKAALGQLNPWVFNTSRLTLATLMLGFLAWIEVRFRPAAPTRMVWRPFLLFALLNGFLYQIFFFLGISQTTAGNTALLLSSMPMWTAAFSFLFIRERLPALTWGGLAVTFCGTLFVLLQNPTVDLSGSYLVGNLFIMGGAMTWAAATVISRPLLQSMSPLRLAFLSSLITMPLHFAVCWPYLEDAWPQLTQPGNIAAIVYSGSISTGVAYATWHYGVRHLGGSRAGVYQNVVTLVAVIGGWLCLSEPVLIPQFVGGLAIIAGVILMRIKR